MTEPIARTVKDFCERYGIGKTKTFELIKNGKLQTAKIAPELSLSKKAQEPY